jgi:hypothetical protein
MNRGAPGEARYALAPRSKENTMARPRELPVDTDVMTLADLRHALDRKERELRDLLARKEKLADELAELGEMLQAMLVGSDVAAGRAAPPRAPHRSTAAKVAHVEKPAHARRKRKSDAGEAAAGSREGSLQAVIRSVLERVIGPLKVSEIVAAVRQSGYASKSANLNVIIGNRLAQMEDVEKVDRGLYQLKRAAAPTPPPEPPAPLASAATA